MILNLWSVRKYSSTLHVFSMGFVSTLILMGIISNCILWSGLY